MVITKISNRFVVLEPYHHNHHVMTFSVCHYPHKTITAACHKEMDTISSTPIHPSIHHKWNDVFSGKKTPTGRTQPSLQRNKEIPHKTLHHHCVSSVPGYTMSQPVACKPIASNLMSKRGPTIHYSQKEPPYCAKWRLNTPKFSH